MQEEQKIQSPLHQPKQQIWHSYLIFFNIQKKKNLGTLIRSAAAFNVKQIFYIDSSKNPKKFNTFGSQGTSTQMQYRTFPNLKAIRKYCNQLSIQICGIQILQQSQNIICKPINHSKFTGPTAFMLGNQQNGLNSNQKQICDFFTYIPQYSNKTACLNVAVAGSIILYNFAIVSGLKEQQIVGQKFDESQEKLDISSEQSQQKLESSGSQNLYKKKLLNIKRMIEGEDGVIVQDVQQSNYRQKNGNKQVVPVFDVNWFKQQDEQIG